MRDLVELIARWIGWKPPSRPASAGAGQDRPAHDEAAAANEAAIADLMARFPSGDVR